MLFKRIIFFVMWVDIVIMVIKEYMDSGYKEYFSRFKLLFIR